VVVATFAHGDDMDDMRGMLRDVQAHLLWTWVLPAAILGVAACTLLVGLCGQAAQASELDRWTGGP
jgi:hypothetical protein